MKQFTYQITDAAGIHARPAGLLVKLLQGYSCDVMVSCRGKHVDGKRLFALMGLAAAQGDEITLAADGPDEERAIQEAELFLRQSL